MHTHENVSLNPRIQYTRQEYFQGGASSWLISKAMALKIADAFFLLLAYLPLSPLVGLAFTHEMPDPKQMLVLIYKYLPIKHSM